MPKLTDTQSILLNAASQRADLSFYPLPGAHAKAGPRVAKALAALMRAGFAEERETGLAAIGVAPTGGEGIAPAVPPVATAEPEPTPAQPCGTKSATVLALLQRDSGATMPELIAATDWLPHTMRAALTGLRKQGHAIDRGKRDGATCYAIPAAA